MYTSEMSAEEKLEFLDEKLDEVIESQAAQMKEYEEKEKQAGAEYDGEYDVEWLRAHDLKCLCEEIKDIINGTYNTDEKM